MSTMVAEGIEFEIGDLQVQPGLVNAHDHLQYALFPRLGRGPYPNATAWARDIYHPDREPLVQHLRVPKAIRLLWGGLRNLLSGVTTVSHHDPYEAAFDEDFPVRVISHYGWAHSFEFAEDLVASLQLTPPDAPFLVHLGEGTDAAAGDEVYKLRDLGALRPNTVLIHAVGLNADGWRLVKESGASVVWCPRSNLFTLGRTLSIDEIPKGIRIALATDSPLTAEGDLLDEIGAATEISGIDAVQSMVTAQAREVLRIPPQPGDWIATPSFAQPPRIVVIKDRIHLVSPELAEQAPTSLQEELFRITVAGRPPVLVRWNIPDLLERTRVHLDRVLLSGREVAA